MANNPNSIAIIGGGYTGALLAIQLTRVSPRALDITVVEPRSKLGRGLAHSTRHPDHRLNAPAGVHRIFPNEPDHFMDWLKESGALDRDPGAVAPSGAIFPRRGDFGDYVGALMDGHALFNPSGSRIHHVRTGAVGIAKTGGKFTIELHKGEPLIADAAALCTSNESPSRPGPFAQIKHPGFFADPWRADYRKLHKDGRLLVIGNGNTAADIIVALLRGGYRGPIEAVSRRGLLPVRHGGTPRGSLWDGLLMDVPPFIERHGKPARAAELLRLLRADIREEVGEDGFWQAAFDELRDSAVKLWINLPVAEKRRVIRHLRTWYDAHRFRIPPQLEPILDGATESGQLAMGRARLLTAQPGRRGIEVALERPGGARTKETYAAVINCTGPEQNPARTRNPAIRDLLRKGMARPHPCGLGLLVDEHCRVIGRDDLPQTDLFAFGLLTRGTFGESTSVPHIAWQISENVGKMVGQ